MRILLVEDEKKIAFAVKKGLEQEGFAVDIEFDGETGLNAAQNIDYDLLILDRMLPFMSGDEICENLRKEAKKMPILMLTAKDEINEKVEGLNIGADDYLVKPFAFEELVARIRALLRRPPQLKENILKSCDLTLDPVTKEVKRQDKEIILSQKEFSLLEYLMSNADQVISKERIIEHVWDFDADILPNTVEVYIGYLRNKIEKSFKGRDIIKTVRGFGYKIEK